MPAAPTLINLPPPPSDPVTPSDIPGTPNSATTTMSELSTVAIKDGHRGHLPHHGRNAPQPDAERADRISRLAGLERVTTARQPTPVSALTPGAAAPLRDPSGAGYFDPTSGNLAVGARERSTVGSASATGSVGARTTTWASGTGTSSHSVSGDDVFSTVSTNPNDGDVDMEHDIDEGDQDMMDRSSVGGLSDEGTTGSLVAFGEGARTPARMSTYYGSPLKSAVTPSGSGSQHGVRGDPAQTPVASSGLGGSKGFDDDSEVAGDR